MINRFLCKQTHTYSHKVRIERAEQTCKKKHTSLHTCIEVSSRNGNDPLLLLHIEAFAKLLSMQMKNAGYNLSSLFFSFFCKSKRGCHFLTCYMNFLSTCIAKRVQNEAKAYFYLGARACFFLPSFLLDISSFLSDILIFG